MNQEKISIIVLGVIIVASLSLFIGFEYGEVLINKFQKETTEEINLNAQDDTFIVFLDDTNTLNILLNDRTPTDIENLTITATNPSHGDINIIDNNILYTPNENYIGNDEFNYTLSYNDIKDTGIITLTIKEKVIEFGDCVDLHYIGRYTNDSIFDTSYNNTDLKTGGIPANFFVMLDQSVYPPNGYYKYMYGIEGFTESLIGHKQGDNFSTDPIPPEKAYGIDFKVGDVLEISDPALGADMKIELIEIIENTSLPEEFAGYNFVDPTTMYIFKDISHYIGEKTTLYPTWDNASIVTKINETKIWRYTTPPENLMENFTWLDVTDPYTEITYWENSSSVTTLNNSTIVITHNPSIGEKMEVYTLSQFGLATTIEYTVVGLNDTKINTSYYANQDDLENISYQEFDRTISIDRNQSEDIVFRYPTEGMDYVLSVFKQFDPTIEYSIHDLAGETLIFEIEIVKIHKTSYNS